MFPQKPRVTTFVVDKCALPAVGGAFPRKKNTENADLSTQIIFLLFIVAHHFVLLFFFRGDNDDSK